MTTLENMENIRTLLILAENSIENAIRLYAELQTSYDNLINNAKAIEVAGLKRPNFFTYIQELKVQKEIISTLKFHIEIYMEDNKKLLEENKK